VVVVEHQPLHAHALAIHDERQLLMGQLLAAWAAEQRLHIQIKQLDERKERLAAIQ
jgi:hypothetical protein